DKRNATILTPQMISAGTHLNAVGGDCPGKTELHPDILRRADVRVVVEYEPQSRIEGEIQQMNAAFPVIELAALLAGQAPGRAHGRGRRGPGLVHGTGGAARGGTGRRVGCARAGGAGSR